MFYGYESEDRMRARNPRIADHLISIAKNSTMTVCTRGRNCIGSMDGETFLYKDGTSDTGKTIEDHRAEYEGDIFRW